VQWDIQWHVLIGRDSFWIPPDVMTYAGVALAVLVSFGVLAWETLIGGSDRVPGAPPVLRVLGLTGTHGFHLAAWVIGLTVLAMRSREKVPVRLPLTTGSRCPPVR